ncbi:MAG TPA: sulfite exporter TauE/SafE family protein [Methylomirabilota bacterium]|nr:sulfite exporter TauE/SafE family protein [Methylomirabilota bacterium]
MTPEWALGALVIAAASFVMGLAGFGIGLVALAFLPFFMSPVTAVVLTMIYALLSAIVVLLPLRRDVEPIGLPVLLLGTIAGAPLGIWVLATLPATTLNRLIGAVLLAVVALEWLGVHPERLRGRGWALGAGVVAGVLGGAVGTPGPPVVLYAAAQGWSPRTIKANLQIFFIVNEAVILAGYWWAGLLTRDVWRFTAIFFVPAALGLIAGMALFARVDQRRFRQIVFALLFASGAVLLVRG